MNECLCYKQIDRERMKREQEREDGRRKKGESDIEIDR